MTKAAKAADMNTIVTAAISRLNVTVETQTFSCISLTIVPLAPALCRNRFQDSTSRGEPIREEEYDHHAQYVMPD